MASKGKSVAEPSTDEPTVSQASSVELFLTPIEPSHHDYSILFGFVVDEKYVDFSTTVDPKSLEILQLLRNCRLRKFCSLHVEEVLVYDALEFLSNLREHDGALFSEVRGEHVEVDDDDLDRLFGLPEGNLMPDE